MRSHARNNRRHRGNKGQDDDHYLVPQEETETYTRLHKPSQRTESYRSSSTSNRAPYDTNREGSTSRTRHLDTFQYADPDDDRHIYTLHDGYHRHGGGRDEYEYVETRDPDPWSSRPHHDVRYSQSHEEWSHRYDHGYVSSSYAESSSWNPPLHDARSTQFDHWPTEETRVDDRRGMAATTDRHHEQEWHRDPRRHKGPQNFQSDSGWDTRRGGKGWDEPPHVWDDTSYEKDRPKVEDRSWEPAPSWQPSGRREFDQNNRNGQRNNYASRNSKGGKRGAFVNKQKRDWRNDDGNLNNWTKRDSHGMQDKAPKTQRGKHPRSVSRSRSRSPTESYYSRRSSRGRSKSRSVSPSPKRRRRGISPPVPRSRTPSDRGRTWNSSVHFGKGHSPSPTPARSPGSVVDGGRSISSASSVSTERSPSRSPRTRSIHRLPLTTAPTLSPTSQRTLGNTRDVRQRNGKVHTNGKQSNIDRRRSGILGQTSSVDSMPPPSTIPTSHTSRMTYPPRDINSSRSFFSERKADISASTRFTPLKYAGFKPITQTNSALKKFFPGDDDDMELASDDQLMSSSSTGPSIEETTHESDTFIHMTARDDSSHRGNNNRSPFQTVEKGISQNGIPPSPQQDASPSLVDKTAADDVRRLRSLGSQGRLEPDSSEVPITPSMGAPGELYRIISQVGEGTFGKVYKAQNTVTKLHVALKRIRMESEKDGFPVTAMREIKLLQSLRHANVVQLYEMMVSNGSVYMVFEYMDHDLTGVLSQTQFTFTDAHLKSLCHQMLAGLAYLHHKGVIHRDIKGSNILINNRGELKLGDFGLARFYQKRRCTDYTNRVITLWYRPPELLFGATVYGPEVDMWSAGCIMLELFTKKPVFQGNDEIHQLDVVYKIIGTPTPERWAGVLDLPWYELVKPKDAIPNHFRELFQKWMSPAALDLAERLLAYDPSQRVTAIQAMDAPYFIQEEPRAAPPVGLATLEGEWHELETKRERAKRRRKPEPIVQ